MSLNQICGYDANDVDSYIDARMENLFITDNLNLQMDFAIPGDELIIQPGGNISWEAADSVANESLEHFQTRFNQILPLSSTVYTQLGLAAATIPDPLLNISIEDDTIRIRNRLKAVFLLIVKYAVNVISQGSCYEFKLQRKFSLNPLDGDWEDYENYGKITSTVLNHDIFAEQTLCCQIPIDSYSTDLNNTYLRFLYRKAEPTSPDTVMPNQATSITLVRLV